jgi:hypothetical protein
MEARTGGIVSEEKRRFQSVEIDQTFQGLDFIAAWCRCRSRSMFSPVGMEFAASRASSLPWHLLSSSP